ncbi:C1 family peptidase [Streptomyces sp. NPDC014864]|uniref:C1 family peptidase n=1 Tax=Streptomyces sp. NPDC014864 TaxID=3364924 RepID=UPI0036F5F672
MLALHTRRFVNPADARLGRHVRHDPASLSYGHPVLPKSAIQSVSWQRRIPILDQGQLGSCTGNALTGVLGTDSAGRTASTSVSVKADSRGVFRAGTYVLDEAFAVKAYSLNTLLDSFKGNYPPTDTGSSGLAAAKTGKALGLLTGYTHAFSVDALRSALQSGSVLWGTVWLRSMFETDADGFVKVDRTSGEAGGHELVISGYDVAEDVYEVQNSWGTSWGVDGYAYVHGADMAWLLSQDGDITVPTYAPAPVDPAPVSPVVNADQALFAAFSSWAKAKGL